MKMPYCLGNHELFKFFMRVKKIDNFKPGKKQSHEISE